MLDSGSPVINGSGAQTRDFVFVRDVAQANLLAVNSNFSGELNISTATENIDQWTLFCVTGDYPLCCTWKTRPPVTWNSCAASFPWKSPAGTGLVSTISLAQGLSETVRYFKEKLSLPNSAFNAWKTNPCRHPMNDTEKDSSSQNIIALDDIRARKNQAPFSCSGIHKQQQRALLRISAWFAMQKKCVSINRCLYCMLRYGINCWRKKSCRWGSKTQNN